MASAVTPKLGKQDKRGSWKTADSVIKAWLWLVSGLVVLAALAPVVVVVISAASTTSYAVFPPEGLTLHWYSEVLTDSKYLGPAWLSFWVSICAAIFDVVLSIMLMLGLEVISRNRVHLRRWHSAFSAFCKSFALSPMMFPTVVIGVALLMFVPRVNLYGSTISILIAHTIVVLPFAIILVESGLASSSDSVRRSALILGASPFNTFRLITLPLARLGIISAWSVAFVMSVGQVTVDVFLQARGAVPLPIYLYNRIYNSPATTDLVAAASLMAVLTALFVGIAAALLLKSKKGVE